MYSTVQNVQYHLEAVVLVPDVQYGEDQLHAVHGGGHHNGELSHLTGRSELSKEDRSSAGDEPNIGDSSRIGDESSTGYGSIEGN